MVWVKSYGNGNFPLNFIHSLIMIDALYAMKIDEIEKWASLQQINKCQNVISAGVSSVNLLSLLVAIAFLIIGIGPPKNKLITFLLLLLILCQFVLIIVIILRIIREEMVERRGVDREVDFHFDAIPLQKTSRWIQKLLKI